MGNRIDDDMLDYVSILAKLELEGEEREKARLGLERMLDYVGMLNELDTSGAEPLVQAVELENVFREDVVTNGDDREDILKNAPAKKDGQFVVPRTI